MGAIEILITVAIPMMLVIACAWLRLRPTFKVNLVPLGCLGVLTVGSVFGHDFFHLSAGPLPLTLDRILLMSVLGFFLWRFLTGREDIARLNRVDLAIFIWLGVITISTVTHDFSIMNRMPASRLLFFNWMPVVLYLVTRHCKLEVADLKLVSVVMGLFGLYLAITAVAEMTGRWSLVFPRYIVTSEFQEFFGRGRGPFLNPVANGVFQTICFCSVLMWWPHQPANSTGRRFNIRWLLVGLALVISIGVYATLTRSTWIGLVAACGLFIFLPASQPAKGAMVMLATVASIFLAPLIIEKVVSFKRDRDVSQADMERSAQMRPLFAIVAWEMFQDRPLAGVGFGQYSKAKYPYLSDPHTDKPLSITRGFMQHNVFLAYVTELGLIGLVALLGLLGQFGRVSWRVWRNRETELWARQFGLAGAVLVACYVLNGMFHDVSIVPMMHMLMFFWLGLVNNIASRPQSFCVASSADVPSDQVDTTWQVTRAA